MNGILMKMILLELALDRVPVPGCTPLSVKLTQRGSLGNVANAGILLNLIITSRNFINVIWILLSGKLKINLDFTH